MEPLSWTEVRSFDAHRVVVDHAAYAGRTQDRQGLLLARDVLDTQVIDLEGLRVARVGDVDLALRDGVLRPVAVDVGLAPLARRLGLGRLARRLREETIAWEGLYLASGHGHRVTLPHRAADVHRLDHDELMALVGGLPPALGAEVLATARPGKHADPLAVARAAGRPHRRFRVMRARKRAPSKRVGGAARRGRTGPAGRAIRRRPRRHHDVTPSWAPTTDTGCCGCSRSRLQH